MALADTNRVSLKYIAETAWGTTPATPAMKAMRFTGHTIKHNKTQVESAEIRNDRMIPSIIRTGVTCDGAINIEHSNTTFNDFILAALCAPSWANVTSPGAGTTGVYAKNGTTKYSFTFEEQFTDITNAYVAFTGMRVDQWMLNIDAQKVVTGSFNLFGQKGAISTTTLAASTVAASTTPIVSASADVADLVTLESLTPVTAGITKLSLTLKNNLRHRPIVGSQYDDDHGYGSVNVTVNMTALVPDLSLFAASIDHTDFTLDIPLIDDDGVATVIRLPKLKVTGNPAVGAQNQDVTIDLTCEAFRDPTTDSMIEVFVYTPTP